MRGASRVVALLALLVASASGGRRARAQAPPPLQPDERYTIDVYQGPVIGSTRVIGLGGAYSAIAEGAVGIPFNAAAYAQRPYYSNSNFDWDFAFDFLAPGLFQDSSFDYDGNGRSSTYADSFVVLVGGLMFQYKGFGGGLHVAAQTYDVRDASGKVFSWDLVTARLGVAYAFARHQLLVGAGIVAGIFSVDQPGTSGNQTLFSVVSSGFEVGALWRPRRWPLRAALSFRTPSLIDRRTDACSDNCPQGFVLPARAELPWELRAGFAYYLGAQPFNPTPRFAAPQTPAPAPPPSSPPSSRPASRPTAATQEKLSAYEELKRSYRGGRYVAFCLDLVLVGTTRDAIGPDGLLEQVRERVGESISLAAHLGVESEIVARRLRARVGSYWEAGRYADSAGRIHGTVSLSVRLFDMRVLGARSLLVAAAFDGAARYTNLGLSIGFWH